MSRDFILVFSGGVVSLMTTLVVLFVMDYFYRRDQKSKVDRPAQSTPGNETANKPAAVQASLAKISDQKPIVAQTVVSNAPSPVTVKPAADTYAKLKSDDPPLQKPMVDPPSELRVDEKPARTPAIEQKVQPGIVNQTPALVVDEKPIQKPAAENQSEPKVSEPVAHEPVPAEASQPAAAADTKPQPPRIVPPETIKKKALEENAARAPSKEQDE